MHAGTGAGKSGRSRFFNSNDTVADVRMEVLEAALDVVIGNKDLRDITSVGFSQDRLRKVHRYLFIPFFVVPPSPLHPTSHPPHPTHPTSAQGPSPLAPHPASSASMVHAEGLYCLSQKS